MGLFDQSQGLMGLGQQPQGYNPYATNRGLPDPRNPNYMGQQGATGMSDDLQGAMGLPMFDRGFAPYNPQNTLGQQPNPATQEVPNYEMPMGDDKNIFVQNDRPMNYQQPQGMRTNVSSPTDALDRGYMNLINQRSQAGLSYPSAEEYRNTNIDAYRNAESQLQETTPALRPTPQPPQIFQPQPMQPSNPVNTQTVQPNFMGQTPFGQAQTGQFTSTNPFVQAAQANAQGNIAGALQATAANRINQQTPYGSLQYQQTGTDAQGNPIWSANQQLSPELQQLTQSSLAGLQASQANPMYGINPGETYSNAIMQRLQPQQRQQAEALDAQLANQGIMPGSEAYNRAKTLQGQTQNDALTSAIVGGMQTGLQAQGLQNTTAANIRNLATPGYVTPYNQATVAGPDYLSAYTSQNATDIARQNAEAAQRSSLLGGLAGLGSSAILGGTGANSALGGLLGLGSKGLESIGSSGLWSSLFGGTGPAITGDQDFLKSIGLDNTTYGSGIGGMLTDPLEGIYTESQYPFAGYEDFLGF